MSKRLTDFMQEAIFRTKLHHEELNRFQSSLKSLTFFLSLQTVKLALKLRILNHLYVQTG
jgi:hypothetical protein